MRIIQSSSFACPAALSHRQPAMAEIRRQAFLHAAGAEEYASKRDSGERERTTQKRLSLLTPRPGQLLPENREQEQQAVVSAPDYEVQPAPCCDRQATSTSG